MLAIADPELDNGPRTNRSATMRMCAVTPRGAADRRADPLCGRAVRRGDRGSEAQASRPRPVGFGLRIERLRKRSGVTNSARGFKRDVRVAATLAADTEALLARFARRGPRHGRQGGAGRLRLRQGCGRPRAAAVQSPVKALIHASDGAADGIRKLDALVGQNAGNDGESGRNPMVNVLTSEQLDLALGPVKCDTCCPARGPGEQDVPVT